MPALDSIPAYEYLIYNVRNEYAHIRYSTLILKRFGAHIAEVSGTIFFENDIRLNVKELIDFRRNRIQTYSYEVYAGGVKQYWYDNQPHPGEPSLQATDPHHKHIHPDIKHNRVPSPSIRFDQNNLPFLIREIIKTYFSESDLKVIL